MIITSDLHNGPNYSYNSTEGGIIYDRFSYQLDRKNKVAIDCRCINSKCKEKGVYGAAKLIIIASLFSHMQKAGSLMTRLIYFNLP